jgi:AAA domain
VTARDPFGFCWSCGMQQCRCEPDTAAAGAAVRPARAVRVVQQGEPPADEAVDEPDEPLFVDVAAMLDAGLPPPPEPVVLRRVDGRHLFYAGKVNVLFGDPESGKTWIAYAAVVETLGAGRRAAVVDVDHNGVSEILGRLLALGARPEQLRDPERFRLAEPNDGEGLRAVVAQLSAWRPAVAVVDSIGEVLPMLGLSSNSPDDYTIGHRLILTALARAGAAVIGVDHMPKAEDARAHGQTGTLAKRRAVSGVTYRVTLAQVFAPGRGGAARLTVGKDRPGGVRAHCPVAGKSQPAGRFVMEPLDDGGVRWWIDEPRLFEVAADSGPDVAELDALDPRRRVSGTCSGACPGVAIERRKRSARGARCAPSGVLPGALRTMGKIRSICGQGETGLDLRIRGGR